MDGPRTDESDHLRGLADAAAAMAGELSIDSVFEHVLTHARAITGARYAALGVIGEDGNLARFVHQGMDPQLVRTIGALPTGKGVLGLLLREPTVIRLADLSSHPDSFGFPPGHPPMGSFLGAPVRSGGAVYGNLYLTDKPEGFDEDDERTIRVLAAQAGAAIENARLSAKLAGLAVQDERDRISRELHDGVIQTLFSIGLGLDALRTVMPADPARAEERLDGAIDAIDGTIRELRNFIFHLRPQDAASMGFARGLTELAREYEINALVRPDLDIPRDIDALLPEEVAPELLAVVREALSNVSKHAFASHVSVAVATGTQIEVVVADDGVGFATDTLQTGRGLENIRDRAAALGADLQVDSAPGEGTRLRLAMPCQDGAGSTGEEPA